ncbi:hypothetical protein TNCV_1247981 [Trichonephila clavipes]|nr:hypothetical protein TNCV_1247981 [Trichonephila clavipes]
MVLLPEEVGEKGFLESRSPTFRIDSSRKGHARGSVLRVLTGGRRHKRALDDETSKQQNSVLGNRSKEYSETGFGAAWLFSHSRSDHNVNAL